MMLNDMFVIILTIVEDMLTRWPFFLAAIKGKTVATTLRVPTTFTFTIRSQSWAKITMFNEEQFISSQSTSIFPFFIKQGDL